MILVVLRTLEALEVEEAAIICPANLLLSHSRRTVATIVVPLIAWLLGGINLLFGQSEFSLRASGPILHLLTSLILWQAGSKIGGVMAGRYAAILWVSLPAVGLGSFVISTDSVMLPFWAAGLYFILAAHTARTGYLAYMAGAGIQVRV